MGVKLEDFVQAANESIKDEVGYGLWLRYDDYEIQIDKDDAHIKAPLSAGRPRECNPLLVRGLFLEFAELAEGGEITQDDWLDWTRQWGVLGVGWREGQLGAPPLRGCHCGGWPRCAEDQRVVGTRR